MSAQPFLIAAAGLFSMGIYGILVRRNAVMVLLSIELILNAVNINFVVFNQMLSDVLLNGHIFSVFISDFISLIDAKFDPEDFDTLTFISFSVYSISVRLNSFKYSVSSLIIFLFIFI